MSVAVVLLAVLGTMAAFLYLKKLIGVEKSALQPKTNPAQLRITESRLPCTAKEPTKLNGSLEETANVGHVPDIPEGVEGRTAVVAIGSMVHLPDLQGGFAAMSAKFNMMATPQWSILCETESSANKEWLSNEATRLYGELNHATEDAATRGVIPDQATASALRHMRESRKRKKGSGRSVSAEANISRW